MAPTTNELVKDLLELQTPFALDLSKDGKTVIYALGLGLRGQFKAGEHNQSSIWCAESGKANSARQLTSGLLHDRSPAISPDGKTVVFLSDRSEQGKSCAIYALSLAGGEPYPLTPVENEQSIAMLKWSPDGSSIAYISADEKTQAQKQKDKTKDDPQVWGEDWFYNRLKVIHFSTRTTKIIASLNEHISDFDWHTDGKQIAFTTKPNPDIESVDLLGSHIYTVAADGQGLKKIIHIPSEIYTLTYTASGIYYIGYVTRDNPVSAIAVWRLKTEDDAQCERVAHGDTDCAYTLRKVGNDVACYVQHGLEDWIVMVDGGTLTKQSTTIISWAAAYSTNSEEVLIALVKGDINTPNEVYTTTASGGALVKLSDHGVAFKDLQLAKTSNVSCETLDGTETIEGVLHIPTAHSNDKGIPSKPLAAVIAVHGGPYSRVSPCFNPAYFYFTEVLLNAGYAVMHPNYRGSSGRGEAFAATSRGGMGKYDEPDVVALTNHCIEKGFFDKDNLAVTGWSQGGYLSYLCSVRNGEHGLGWRFKAAIPGAGVSDWSSMAFTSDVGFIESKFSGCAPWAADKTDTTARAGSAIWAFNGAAKKKIVPPMLILHGEKDVRVPIEQARAFRRAMIYHKLPFEYVVYPREEHMIKEKKHIEDMLQRTLRFVDQHLTKVST